MTRRETGRATCFDRAHRCGEAVRGRAQCGYMTSPADRQRPSELPPPEADEAHQLQHAGHTHAVARKPAPAGPASRPRRGAKPAGHDTLAPPTLVAFMLKGWRAPSGKLPPKLRDHAAFHARRRALSKLYPGETPATPTGHEKMRANDTHYRFRANTNFFYLTGNQEPDYMLIMMPTKMIREMPLPMPRAVICSPSHIRNMVPPTSVIMQEMRKNIPGSATAAPMVPRMPSSPTAMPQACTMAMTSA